MDKLIGYVAKSSALVAAGVYASDLSFRIQENVYGRPNDLENVSNLLHNPDYLTSFFYPLTLMYAMRSFFELGGIINKEMGNTGVSKTADLIVRMTPLIVMGINMWNELCLKSDYTDKPAVDLLVGAAACVTYIMTTDAKQDFSAVFSKLSDKLNAANFSKAQMADSEIIGI